MPTPSPLELKQFQRTVKSFYKAQGRVQLPWRQTTNPYHVLVSEIMLQQTQVDRVVPKYLAFIKKFPTTKKLASATFKEVLTLWQGLGYNRRALSLQKAAQMIEEKYQGKMPDTIETLLELPGVGPYTAAAVATFAFNQAHTLIETNIRTIYIHHFFADKEAIDDQELLPLITATLDIKNPRTWYWALMDYGSYLKKLHPNPSRQSKHHHTQTTFKNSNRQVRGQILKVLTVQSPIIQSQLLKQIPFAPARVRENLTALEEEGLLEIAGKKIWLN